jgi:hypothetical protein
MKRQTKARLLERPYLGCADQSKQIFSKRVGSYRLDSPDPRLSFLLPPPENCMSGLFFFFFTDSRVVVVMGARLGIE